MPYAPTWSQQDALGHVVPGEHFIWRADFEELADEINRRRRLTCRPGQDYAVLLNGMIHRGPMDAMAGGADFRHRIEAIAAPTPGGFGGDPQSPSAMRWLWPVAGDDENKTIVTGTAGEGEIGLLGAIGDWADAGLPVPQAPIRATHVNQVRRAMELLTRGRWEFPIYFAAGIFSVLPDAVWLAGNVGRFDNANELRAAGFFTMRQPPAGEVLGLCGVEIRPESFVEITADTDCMLEVYQSLRPMAFIGNLPTWRRYDPAGDLAWQEPGGLGSADAQYIGELALAAGVPSRLSVTALETFLANVSTGGLANVMVRRLDIGPESIEITGRVVVEFDLA